MSINKIINLFLYSKSDYMLIYEKAEKLKNIEIQLK